MARKTPSLKQKSINLDFYGLSVLINFKTNVKSMRLRVGKDAKVTLSMPFYSTQKMALSFLEMHKIWLENTYKKALLNLPKDDEMKFLGQIYKIKFDEKGLVPAIIQDYYTKEVLTLAYMNKESLEITLRDKKTCFYSRSRQELWLKGETSGNYQNVVSLKYDCDADALLVKVKKDGPACHTGSESCFFNSLFETEDYSSFTPEKLYELIKDRKINPSEKSYTTYLFEKGLDKILKKVGEECTEVIIGAKNNDNDELKYEIADLYYHTLVLMIEQGLTIQDIKEELAKRHIIDHKVKQEKMGGEK